MTGIAVLGNYTTPQVVLMALSQMAIITQEL